MATEPAARARDARRRQALCGLGALGLSAVTLPLGGCGTGAGGDAARTLLIGGVRFAAERYGVAAVDMRGRAQWQFETPARVHDVAVRGDGRLAAVVARRPGRFIHLFEPHDGRVVATLTPPPGTVFEGHACFGADALWAVAACTGQHGRQVATLLRYGQDGTLLDECRLPGERGAHQVRSVTLHDGQPALLLAIGGWEVEGRRVVNATDFDSALLLLDAASGAERARLAAPHDAQDGRPLSLRHFDVTAGAEGDGRTPTVWVGLQYPEPVPRNTPLVWCAALDGRPRSRLRPAAAPPGGWETFGGYVASVAATGEAIVATSPHGHRFARWACADGRCLGAERLLDAAPAVAVSAHGWAVGAGSGAMVAHERDHDRPLTSPFHWDNHWAALAARAGTGNG